MSQTDANINTPEQRRLIIGIDPGASGGVAMLEASASNVRYVDGLRMPVLQHRNRKLVDVGVLNEWLADMTADNSLPSDWAVVVEQVASRPHQGIASSFNFGRMAGAVEGWATALRVPTRFVTPNVWKGKLGLNSDKQSSLDMAKLEFGDLAIWRVKANDGVAEGALMALWSVRFP